MATPQIGDEFAGYRIEALLGRGGMGIVYRAEQQRPHRRVALKLLATELSSDPSFRERFIRESDSAAAIEHPNIIPVYDAGEVDDQLYLAMRYVQGSDLKDLIEREGRLDPERALSFVSQVGGALDMAHSRGLVHRDVKPQNILIASGEGPESTDHVYLTDFGLTKHAASRTGLTAAGHFVGTIDYVAPEQIEGKAIDNRTDVYSLGCVFFEALTGRLPFERDTEVSVMYAHISDPPPSARALRTDMPPGLDGVIAKALAKNPGDRFSTCRELVVAAREELGIVSGERPQARGSAGGTVVAAAGAAGLAGAASRPGETVQDAPSPAGVGGGAAGTQAQQGGGWQGGQQGGQGGWQEPGQQGQQGGGAPGWQQGPSDPTWQGPPAGGGGGSGGWGGPPPGGGGPGGPGGPGWGEEPPAKGGSKTMLFGIIGALVVIAIAVGAFLFLSGDDEPEPDPAVSPTSAAPSPSESVTSASPAASPSVSVSPSTDGTFPSPGEEDFLYKRIPTDIQPSCTRQTPDLMPNGASIGITCTTTGGADFVSYYKYPTLPAMSRQYRISVSIAGATADTGTCPSDIPSETTYERADGEIIGRLVCYDFEGAGRIEWTNNKLLVYSEAVSLNGMSQGLYDFWTTAGPNTKPSS